MAMFSSTFRWLQRKRYQYEVTFSLYMLTPTEKFIFNSFLFLFFSMIIIAGTLYLPHHVTFVFHRAWFYYNGEEGAKQLAGGVAEAAAAAAATSGNLSETVKKVVRQTMAAVSGGGKGAVEGKSEL
ncbi:hypothetical protein HYALB_00009468 [Hymenoscyphus albidus]|uniref:Uncharacterized protein n=1 Tax=Hymenoscyphus albidus TaxID=595503 RepID=A0A9N9LUS6_9HELO|nr:hypothetical protein HYALB_00009468 [Hymenoscyphus albidus]